MNQGAFVYAGLFDGTERAAMELGDGRKGYVNGHALGAGDALKAGSGVVTLDGGKDAEVLVSDLPAT